MALMCHQKIKFTLTIFAVLLLLIAISHILWSNRAPELDFLKQTPLPAPTNMEIPSPATYPEPFIYGPSGPHNSTLILLHGTSQDGPSFGRAFLEFVVEDVRTLPQLFPGTRFVFPTGRKRWCTVLGSESHAWFDFVSFADRTLNESTQIEGLSESVTFLEDLVEAETQLLVQQAGKEGAIDVRENYRKQDARRRVVVGGFSQGAAMSVIALLAGVLNGYEGSRIGGVVGLSGWCPFRKQILDAIASSPAVTKQEKFSYAVLSVRKLLGLTNLEEGKGIGVQTTFLGHGEEDAKMKLEWGMEMGELLGSMIVDVQFKGYGGLGHWWSEREIEDIAGWLKSVWGAEERVPFANVTNI